MNEPKDWPHIRCKPSCKIGRDALDGKGLDATASDQMTFSIYSLLGAGGGADELLLLQLNEYESILQRKLSPGSCVVARFGR